MTAGNRNAPQANQSPGILVCTGCGYVRNLSPEKASQVRATIKAGNSVTGFCSKCGHLRISHETDGKFQGVPQGPQRSSDAIAVSDLARQDAQAESPEENLIDALARDSSSSDEIPEDEPDLANAGPPRSAMPSSHSDNSAGDHHLLQEAREQVQFAIKDLRNRTAESINQFRGQVDQLAEQLRKEFSRVQTDSLRHERQRSSSSDASLSEIADKVIRAENILARLETRLSDKGEIASVFEEQEEQLGKAIKSIQKVVEASKQIAGVREALEKANNAMAALARTAAGAALAKKQEPSAPPVPSPSGVAFSDEALARIVEKMRAKLLAPEGLHACLNAYHEWLLQRCGDEEKRLRMIERLPSLFDFVEMELRALRPADDASPPSPERQSVVAELEKLHERMKDWQESVGLIRFPKPRDAFDITKHEVVSVVETDDADQVDSVKEVIRSGYCLAGDGQLLRRARVVRWVKRRGK